MCWNACAPAQEFVQGEGGDARATTEFKTAFFCLALCFPESRVARARFFSDVLYFFCVRVCCVLVVITIISTLFLGLRMEGGGCSC